MPARCLVLLQMLRVAVRDEIDIAPYVPPASMPNAAMIYAEVFNFTDKPKPAEMNADALIARLLRVFMGQILAVQQQAAFEFEGNNFRIAISSMLIDVNGQSKEAPHAFLRENTAFIFTNTASNPVKITGQKGYATTQLFKSKQINFEQLGIGGLDKQVGRKGDQGAGGWHVMCTWDKVLCRRCAIHVVAAGFSGVLQQP